MHLLARTPHVRAVGVLPALHVDALEASRARAARLQRQPLRRRLPQRLLRRERGKRRIAKFERTEGELYLNHWTS